MTIEKGFEVHCPTCGVYCGSYRERDANFIKARMMKKDKKGKALQLLIEAANEIYHLMSEMGDDPNTVGCFGKIRKFIKETEKEKELSAA